MSKINAEHLDTQYASCRMSNMREKENWKKYEIIDGTDESMSPVLV